MLKLKHISKIYETKNIKQKALDDININFRKSEFVMVLGPSGSGKSTLLNIIGGLDNSYDGELIINNLSTKRYKEKDWNYYRNTKVGFIFQSYNLIEHISALDNVKLPYTLKSNNNGNFAKLMLSKVGMEGHLKKRPSKLSGGQKQKVSAIRALVNNPDIILADEPTGALDKESSIKIMEIIKNISKNKLVIMVTHNESLARKYANRIIKIEDGKIISDSRPYLGSKSKEKLIKTRKIRMKFKDALKLSLNNIRTKKKRMFLISFASSIGIIGLSLVLSISKGFNKKLEDYEVKTVSSFPLLINNNLVINKDDNNKKTDKKYLYSYSNSQSKIVKENITSDFIDYLDKIDKNLVYSITYKRITNFNILSSNNIKIKSFDSSMIDFIEIPSSSYLYKYYDVISGRMPLTENEVILIVGDNNKVDETILDALFMDKSGNNKVSNVIGKELKIVMNDDMYYSINNKSFSKNILSDRLYNNLNNETIKFVGVVKEKKNDSQIVTDALKDISGTKNVSKIGYKNELLKKIISKNNESNVVKCQEKEDNIITMGNISFNQYGITKKETLTMLGKDDLPYTIGIYPKDFTSKKKIKAYLDNYSKKIIYTDYANKITSISSKLMKLITIILIFFSSISLLVSSLMIAIVTYISVLERTKEIGILRSVGASKCDIIKLFNAENFIVGLSSGIIGIIASKVLIVFINIILSSLTGFNNLAILSMKTVIFLVFMSTFITIISGLIPAYMASKKNMVEALSRSY